MNILNLKVLSDLDCNVYVDNEFVAVAKKDTIVIVPLDKGEYWVQFIAQFNSQCKIEKIINIEHHKVEILNFLGLLENHPEWHRDEDIYFDDKHKCYISKFTEKEMFSCQYKVGFDFEYGFAKVLTSNDYWGCINRTGNTIIPCIYDEIVPTIGNDGFEEAMVEKHKKWGVINKIGEVIIPCAYDAISKNGHNFFRVKKDNKWGYIDEDGNIKTPCIYDKIVSEDSFFHNLNKDIHIGHPLRGRMKHIHYYVWFACVTKGESEYYVNGDGKEYKVAVPCIWDEVTCFDNDLARVRKNTLWGCIDKDGNVITPCQYDYIEPFEDNGLAMVNKGNKFGYINKSGKEIIPCIYRLASLVNHLKVQKHNGLCGLVDIEGKEIIPYPYNEKKYTKIVKDGKYGLLNEYGKEFVPCIYDSISRFYYGVAQVVKEGKCGLINRNGVEFISCEYDFIGDFINGLAIIKQNGLFGVVNLEGKLVKPITSPYYLQELYITQRTKLCKKGKWGFIKE